MYQYTDKELKAIMKSMVIVVDTREQANTHIIEHMDKKKIAYATSESLPYGDYTCFIPKNEQFGIMRDLWFTDIVTIERKNSLEELSSNLTKHRERFEAELQKHKGRMYLMIENATYEDLLEGKYNTQYNKASYIASLHAFQSRYDLDIRFIKKDYAGQFIAYTLAYHVREYFKKI